MHLILAEIINYPKKESVVTQKSSVVPAKINFRGTAIAKKGKICISVLAGITNSTEITLSTARIINSVEIIKKKLQISYFRKYV